MSQTFRKIVYSFIGILVAINLFAQQAAKSSSSQSSAKPAVLQNSSKPTHYIDLWGNVGYANFMDNLSATSVPGGYGAGLGLGYDLEIKKFRFNMGVEFDWLNSATRFNPFTAQRQMLQPYSTMTYNYNFTDYKETRNAAYLNVPIMFGGQFNRYFFMVGAKVGMNIMANYKVGSLYTINATDNELIDNLENMNNHFLDTYELSNKTNKGTLALDKLSVAASAEFGIDLDEWLQVKPRPLRRGQRPRKKTFKESLHYRASVFADYYVLDANKSSFATNYANNGQLPVFASTNPMVSELSNSLGSTNFGTTKINPLFVGVKFMVQYELPKKQPKKKPAPKPQPKPTSKPKPKPQPKPVVVEPMLCGIVMDAETQERLDAKVQLFSRDGVDLLYDGVSEMPAGTFGTKLKSGTYVSYITKQGYLPYSDTITFVKDTIYISLQIVKQGKKVVLDNLFFATNQTKILPESEQGLEDLSNFLKENPNVRIRIIGHTDNVGSDTANMRLSEGRAKSVKDDIVKRGVSDDRILYEGKGESEPRASNDTPEGRAENRRVEFVIL